MNFQNTLIGLLALLVATFLAVMFSESAEKCITQLLGVSEKYEALKFLGIGMGGSLIALQALASHRRAKAMEKAAEAQAKANENTEQGQRQERLKNAIGHLGNASDSVRLGGAYELFHLAEDTEALRKTAFDILCAHIRRTTGEGEYREKHESKPSEEIQSLLTLLFVQDHEVFKGLCADLNGSWLKGADLERLCLRKANLSRTHLQGARLPEAVLEDTNLEFAHLQHANLIKANLRKACLLFARLEGTHLVEAMMQGAVLHCACLHGASLAQSRLQGADLSGASLQGANLESTRLEGANLRRTGLQAAFLGDARMQAVDLEECGLQGATDYDRQPITKFDEHMRKRIGEESNLSAVVFAGGLSLTDVDSAAQGLYDEAATTLREKLMPHVGKAISHELPEARGAITGAYTKEEAEKWIAEYETEKAHLRVPRKAGPLGK